MTSHGLAIFERREKKKSKYSFENRPNSASMLRPGTFSANKHLGISELRFFG
jgi:hypothetical protein